MKQKPKNIGYMGSKPKFEGTPKGQEESFETKYPKHLSKKEQEELEPILKGRFTNRKKNIHKKKK